MGFLNSLDIAVSGMSAQRLRLDVIALNVANASNTSSDPDAVYKRQQVVFSEEKANAGVTVSSYIDKKMRGGASGLSFSEVLNSAFSSRQSRGIGVVCTNIVEEQTPATPVYDPTHPDADENGYYYVSNVDTEEEQLDALAATNSYEANRTIFNSMKTLAQKALTIGQ